MTSHFSPIAYMMYAPAHMTHVFSASYDACILLLI